MSRGGRREPVFTLPRWKLRRNFGGVTKRLLLAALACGLAGAFFWWRFERRIEATRVAVSQPNPGQTNFLASPQPKETERFLNLEAARNQLDRTYWTNEIAALRHEQIFVQLWDELRAGSNTLAILGDFPVGEIRVGTVAPASVREHGIKVSRFQPPFDALTPTRWHDFLVHWSQAGYGLEQSEWRQPRFTPGTNGGSARSTIQVTLHGTNGVKGERFIIRGPLQVEWKASKDPSASPVPQSIDTSGLEILFRTGPAPFVTGPPRDITPVGQFHDQPLLVYDLDGDGQSEIILPARNEVFWNDGTIRFEVKPLLAVPLINVTAAVLADFTGDGHADLLCADQGTLRLFRGDPVGQFTESARPLPATAARLENPFVLTAGDVDGDGYLDFWLGQYKPPAVGGQMPTPIYDANDAFPAFLFMNDRKGGFRDATESAGLAAKRFRRTYSASLVDLDDDGDLDLLVVSDFAGADLYLNDGRGHFTDVTAARLDEPHAFGMAHAFGDFNRDGALDFLMIGMDSPVAARLDHLGLGSPERPDYQRYRPIMTQGNRLYLGGDGKFRQTALSEQVAHTGWSWGVAAFDCDNDGDLDLAIANGHLSDASTAEYESQFWRHDIYVGDSREDRAKEMYFGAVIGHSRSAGASYGGNHLNRFFLNEAGSAFREVAYLLGTSLSLDSRSVVADDLDGDGRLDLLITSYSTWPAAFHGLHLYQNLMPATGHWIGFRLRESKPGFSPIGAKVTLRSPYVTQTRQVVTGDSFLCQHAPTIHFGLGQDTQVTEVEIRWPNGRRQKLAAPGLDRYHVVKPE